MIGLYFLRGRRSSVRPLVTVAVLVPVVAMGVGVMVSLAVGLLSAQAAALVLMALGSSLPLAMIVAYVVSRPFTRTSQLFGAGLHQLVKDLDPLPEASPMPTAAPVLPQELARMVEELAETRQIIAEQRAGEQSAEQARSEMVSFMSHDLRTPLAGLRALLEGLEDRVIVDSKRALVQTRDTVERMSSLVDDLFALSRMHCSRTGPVALVSMTELMIDVAGELDASAVARSVELRLDVPEGDPLSIVGAVDDLSRALTNVIADAIRHTDRGARVDLLARRTDSGSVNIAVVDGCGGIPEGSLQQVHAGGWHGRATSGADHAGTGFGLAIARGVVESHRGGIELCTTAGGCRFEVELPARTEPRP